MVSLAHGTNDAQKTMGVITLALTANGTLAAKSNARSGSSFPARWPSAWAPT
jgi:phosphate/sulfate permease